MSNSVRLHRWQPTRLRRPWDSPGKNTGVGCHCLLQCMKVKCESEVTQLRPTLSDPMDCSLPGSSIHGILQARVLEWILTILLILDSTSLNHAFKSTFLSRTLSTMINVVLLERFLTVISYFHFQKIPQFNFPDDGSLRCLPYFITT